MKWKGGIFREEDSSETESQKFEEFDLVHNGCVYLNVHDSGGMEAKYFVRGIT